MGRVMVLGLVSLLMSACTSGGQFSLREGILRTDIGQKAFRSEWGAPDKTMPILSEQLLSSRWGVDTSLLKNLKEPPELWIYERYGVELLFENGDLVAWKTDRTQEQLRAIPSRR